MYSNGIFLVRMALPCIRK